MNRLMEIAEDGIITGEFNKSLEVLNQLISEDPSERALYLRGYLYYCMQDYDKAIPELERVVKDFPDNDEAYYYLSQMHSIRENYEDARYYIEKALELDKENTDYLCDYVAIEQALKNFEHCIQLCDILVEETPDSNFALNARGFAYLQLGETDEAIANFKKNTKDNPMDFVGWTHLGMAYLKNNNLKDARKALTEAIRNNPRFSDAYSHMAYVFFKENDPEKAFLYVNRALELDATNADAYRKRGEFHLAEGNTSDARADLIRSDELGYSRFYDNEVEELLKKLSEG